MRGEGWMEGKENSSRSESESEESKITMHS